MKVHKSIYQANALYLYLYLSFFVLIPLHAQNNFPVIKADSKKVDVIDGEHNKKGWWQIMPERKPDIYYVSIPRKPHRVVFRTDMDSIVFDTQYGESYDFIITMKNGDSAHTRIVARERELMSFVRLPERAQSSSDTIPITIGDNSKIYIEGRVNGSAPLNFQFDLGSGGSIIKKGSVSKAPMTFDGTTFLINSDGRNEVPTSSKNTLTIGSMTWNKNITFIVGDNMDRTEDGLLGNSLFLDKVIEIDYDKKIMIVHDSLPGGLSGYEKQSFILEGVVPYIKASISIGKETYTDWYMFDTGYSGILRISGDLNNKYDLGQRVEHAFNPFKETLILPQLTIGNHNLAQVRAVVHPGIRGGTAGILGNELLKRFNVILDNQNGTIYLNPNNSVESATDGFSPYYFLLLVSLIIIGFFLARRVGKNKRYKGDTKKKIPHLQS